jgi:multidrug efflux pump subunit AcrB
MTSFNLSRWALGHKSFIGYLMIAAVIGGAWSYLRLGRDEDPPFVFKAMVLTARWPGATAEEMMLQVTDRIEKKLQETASLDYLKSITKAGETTIYVFLKGSTPATVITDIWIQVRKKVGDIVATLPQGVQGPFFNDEFGDTFGTIYAFTADGFTHRELRDYVGYVRRELLAVPNVAKLTLIGTQDERIFVEFDTRRLNGLGINRRQVVESLRAQNAITASGVVDTADERIALRVSGHFSSEQGLRALNLYANGHFYRLADVATIRRGYADPPQPMFRYGGVPAIGIGIAMVPGADILRFGADLKRRMAELIGELPIGIEPHLVTDQPVIVAHAVDGFMEALFAAVAIVLAVSFLSLGLRAGAVVALAIPLVLAITFVVMAVCGIAFHRISLGALVIALGLLVDDAMITIESMVSRLEQGADRIAAATHAYSTTAFPMLTGTLVTIAGFVPVGFARSSAGEYTYTLFAVVAIALSVSWLVAVLFAPPLGVAILPRSLADHPGPGGLGRAFRRVLTAALRARYLVIAATLVLFVLALFGTRFVQRQFFPASDRPELLVDLALPQGASINATDRAARRLEALLAHDPDIDHYTLHVGEGAIRFYLTLYQQLPNDFFAQAVIVTKGLAQREAVKERLERGLAEELPGLLTRVYPLELGPPVGWPLQYRISGPDLQQVRHFAYSLADLVAANPRAQKIGFDWNEPEKSVRLEIDQDKARRLGITSQAIAVAINLVSSGLVLTQIRDGTYLIDVVTRAAAAERGPLETLRGMLVSLEDGRTIPLREVARLDYGLEQPVIWRRDRRPTITVQADVVPGAQPKQVTAELAPAIAGFAARLPADYRIETGGTEEASRLGQSSVAAVVPVMLALILTVLMTQLHSWRHMLLALSVAPLGLIGIVAILLPTRTPLGFVAILGIIALSGMIIRNSVILIERIGDNRAAGKNGWDAVLDAATERLRPILLTAGAAILGMLPIARDVFWGPMAFAIIGGLAGATLLTLLFLPALYVACFGFRETTAAPAPAAEQPKGAIVAGSN